MISCAYCVEIYCICVALQPEKTTAQTVGQTDRWTKCLDHHVSLITSFALLISFLLGSRDPNLSTVRDL